MFAIQDEISQAIVSKLRLTLRRTQSSQRTSVEAYDTYLRARALSNQGPDVGTAQQAVRLYEQVIAADPFFAPAYAGLADAYAWMSAPFNGLEFKKALARMRPAALKALELDPLSAEAHAAMGVTYSRERDWANAEKSFRQAIELNPSITHIYNSFSYSTLIPLGKSAEAVQLLRAATQRDPLSQPIRSALAFALIVNGRYDEVIAMYAPNVSDPLQHKTTLVRALTFAGRIEEALPICDSMKGEVGSEHWTAAAYAKAGRLAEVEAMIPRQKQPFQLAFIYAALKDKDRTFDELNQSVEAWGHRVGLFLVSPEMALLRGDDRLDALRKRLNLPVELQPGPRNP